MVRWIAFLLIVAALMRGLFTAFWWAGISGELLCELRNMVGFLGSLLVASLLPRGVQFFDLYEEPAFLCWLKAGASRGQRCSMSVDGAPCIRRRGMKDNFVLFVHSPCILPFWKP